MHKLLAKKKKKKMMEKKKCTPSAKQHEFNNKNIICVWEALRVEAVAFNLTQPLPHVIRSPSYFLYRKIISNIILIIINNLHFRRLIRNKTRFRYGEKTTR